MRILLKGKKSVELEITGYNNCLEERLVQAMEHDNADEAAKVFHLMLVDAGMSGNPKPDLQQMFVAEAAPKQAVFLDANGKPKDAPKEDYEFPLGLLDDVRKYLGLGEWDDQNNLVKHDEFYLSSLYSKYGHETVEEAIDYLE